MSGRLGPSELRARRKRDLTKRNKVRRWRGQRTLVEMQKKKSAERIDDMARKTRAEREQQHRRKVEAAKCNIRRMMRDGEHLYPQKAYQRAVRDGDHAGAEALEEMLGEINAHNREHLSDFLRREVDDHTDRMRDLESRRQEARDLERAAEIAEGARRKAAGIGGGLYATSVPEPEPEEDEPDPVQGDYEDRRRTLMRHGLLSRTPAPPQEGRRKRRRGYTYPPFVG